MAKKLELITDRTAQDVERWQALHIKGYQAMTEAEKAEWLSALKGAYNHVDMNRVEAAVAYLVGRLDELGHYVPAELKTDWTVNDQPTKADMDRYFANVALLRSILPMFSTTPEPPSTQKKLDYLAANDIEQILTDIDRRAKDISSSWYYAGDIFTGEI